MNPLPATFKVKAALPSATVEGMSDTIAGAGLLTAKLSAEELPPPGAAFVATKLIAPAEATSAAVSTTETCVGLAYVVVRAAEFAAMLVVGTNPVPATVTVCGPEPAITPVGVRETRPGTGFSTLTTEADELALELLPFETTIPNCIPTTISEAGIDA